MPKEQTVEMRKVRNVQGELTDLPRENPRATLSSRIRALLLKMTGVPQLAYKYGTLEPNETLTLNTGENKCWCLASDGTYLYAGLYTSPGIITKIDLSTFTRDSSITLETGENICYDLILDDTYLYAGLGTSPAEIVRIRLSDFTRVDKLTLNTGENICQRLAIDGTYLYVGLATTPAEVVRIQLSDFTRVSSVALAFNYCFGLEIDNSYLYATGGPAGAAGSIAKIDRYSFTVSSTLVLNAAEEQPYAPNIDGSFLYVVAGGGGVATPQLVKIDLSTFTRMESLAVGTAGSRLFCIGNDGNYLYLGSDESPAKIHKIDLRTFELYESETLATGENFAGSDVIFDGTYMYIGLYGASPAKIIRRYVIPFGAGLRERKTDRIYESIFISGTEKLKNFIAKTGGTEIGAGKSIPDYLGDYSGGGSIKSDLAAISIPTNEVIDVVIYPAAEDRGTTELDGDGSSPNYLTESSQSNIDEAAGEASPAWTEDIDFEQAGTITVISIYAELHWAQKQTGGGTSSVKMQISGDGGSTWVDMTDNVPETSTSYVDKTRIGVGRWITSITAGTNKLQLRMCMWGGTTSAQSKLREDSYLRLTYRKS